MLLKHQRRYSLASFVSSKCDVSSLQATRTAFFLARPGMKEIVKVKVVGERATVAKPIVQAGTRVICASDCFRASGLWEAELTNIEEVRSKLLEQDVAQVILHCCIASQSIVFFGVVQMRDKLKLVGAFAVAELETGTFAKR